MIKTLIAGLTLVLAEEGSRKRSKQDPKLDDNGAPEIATDDFISGAGFFFDDDGNLMPTSRMSDGRYDHLGHIPDMSLPTDSFVWIQIPFWKVIESKVRSNPEDYIITCQLVNSRGKVTRKSCDTKLEIYIDSDDVMTIFPQDGWTGQAQVTLQAVNINGEHDYTVFNVLVVESDKEV